MKNRKKNIFKLSAFILSMCILSSCSKTKEFTQEDAADIIEKSIEKDTYGVSEMITKFSENLVNTYSSYPCDQYDTSYSFISSGPLVNADYQINWDYTLICGLDVPSAAELNATISGSYSTNRINSNDNSNASLNVTGIEFSASSLNFNGSLSRNGTQTISINSKTRNVTSNINIELTNVSVNKSSFAIESGTGSVVISGNNGDDSFSFSGSIEFNGNGNATLTINGNTYQISV
jgi:hypothetical protein